MMMITNFLAFVTISALSTNGFSMAPSAATRRTAVVNSQLMMAEDSSESSITSTSSRRDIFKNAIIATATAGAVFAISPNMAEAKKPTVARPISFQGVFYDPKHPDGYRTIIAASKKGGAAIMNLSDGVPKGSEEIEKTYKNQAVKVSADGKQLTFDFSFKGGPKNAIGTLAEDGRSITFEDGNVWIKNKNQYDGVYSDPQHPAGYRVLRKKKGSIMEVELNNVGVGSPKDSIFIKGKHQSLFSIPTVAISFQFPVKNALPDTFGSTEEIIASLYLIDGNSLAPYGTITFPDGNRWTQL
ncbi:hypothetical protein FRACYDRAFT_259416 [Fragilariopsis cylindrus CCMP1102]|uniref:Uncharacterized protein n=1 Tax=Fragilariopsis cylindrus CCMP1102 TaxID=635003 RepID=A0A1E7FZH5_9STRA|nr:hypothetical protein FRACYDRAFT_259416 [Fragilariopsis cylindrus CCMP1102]|eukprot:OEU23545.1 hypothetical protein FRACYDRAFT_259416 [Fragilariopsis cylindrus CCMP1102]